MVMFCLDEGYEGWEYTDSIMQATESEMRWNVVVALERRGIRRLYVCAKKRQLPLRVGVQVSTKHCKSHVVGLNGMASDVMKAWGERIRRRRPLLVLACSV